MKKLILIILGLGILSFFGWFLVSSEETATSKDGVGEVNTEKLPSVRPTEKPTALIADKAKKYKNKISFYKPKEKKVVVPEPVIIQQIEKKSQEPKFEGLSREQITKQITETYFFPKLIQKAGTYSKPKFNFKQPNISAPTGTLIKCKTILTVESSNLDTPVVGLITEDVFYNKKLVIPKNTEIHGTASNGRERDRVQFKGDFRLVFQDGKELIIKGTALSMNTKEGRLSMDDGVAGIKGQLLRSDAYADLKYMAASALSGISSASQETVNTVFGPVPDNSLTNSGLQGISQATQNYADLILKRIEEEGYFVRIPAGQEFYFYTYRPIEPELRSYGGYNQGNSLINDRDIQYSQYESEVNEYQMATEGKSAQSMAQSEEVKMQKFVQAELDQRNKVKKLLYESSPEYRRNIIQANEAKTFNKSN